MFKFKSVFGAASAALAATAGKAAAQVVPDELPPYVVPPGVLETAEIVPSADSTLAARVTARTVRDSLVRAARAQIGKRYRYGGVRPETGFDCSGLVRYVMNALSIELPRTAREQAKAGHDLEIPRDTAELRPGDLLTFGRKRTSHIGIYVGEGRFVHASTKAGKVIESKLENPQSSLIRKWRGVRRLVVTGDNLVVRVATGA
ncbi:MAG: C40 family peptidase [Gemmatimonadaceae bacterium]